MIASPNSDFSEPDYFRGLVDGDGSLGFTAKARPFISFATKSENIAKTYLKLIQKITGTTKDNSKNERDNAYNIMLNNEDAQILCSYLYYDDCLALDRKVASAKMVTDWIRPADMKKRTFTIKRWTDDQDKFITSHTIKESMAELDRTKKSIKIRLWRLAKKNPIK
jgi:hypothetical protein